jgi:hypothetical protein
MRLTDLLGSRVVDRDGSDAGFITDVRLVRDGPVLADFGAAFRVHGLVIGRTTIAAHMGFERRNVRGPWLVKKLFSIIQGTPHYATWGQLRSIEQGVVRLRIRAGELPVAEPPR